jgi:ribosomal protein L4
VEILRNLPSGEKSALIVLPEIDKNLIAASRNIYNFRSIQAKDLNCLDVLSFKYLILTKESIKVIRDTFLNKRTLKETFLRQSSTKEEIAPKA